MIESGITSPLHLDPRQTNRRYHFKKHLILAPRGNKSGGSILAAKVAQFLTAVETEKVWATGNIRLLKVSTQARSKARWCSRVVR
jgi:hypothetical protein